MKKSRKISIILVSVFALIGGVLAQVINVNTASGQSGSSQLVQLVVPKTWNVDINIISPKDSSVTNTASNEITFEATGIGHIVLTDQNGNILWEGDQSDYGPHQYTVKINLPDGVGEYIITATITNANNPEDISSSSIKIKFEAVKLPIPSIVPPNTGVTVQFGDYAVPVNYLISYTIYLATIFGAIWFFVIKRRKRANETAGMSSRKDKKSR